MLNASKHHAARAALFVLSGKWVQVAGLLALSALLTGCSLLTGDVAQRGVVEVRENSITIEQAQYGAGGIVAGLLGVVRAWRGGASKGLVAATAGALRGVLAAGKTQPVAKAPPTE